MKKQRIPRKKKKALKKAKIAYSRLYAIAAFRMSEGIASIARERLADFCNALPKDLDVEKEYYTWELHGSEDERAKEN